MGASNCCNSENTNKKNAKVKVIRIKPKAVDGSTFSERGSNQNSCCCGNASKSSCEPITQYDAKQRWILGEVSTSEGMVPQVCTKLNFTDIWGICKVRFGVGRMDYKINPGLYAVGIPDSTSPVLVTANYKLTFDTLRKELDGLNLWIMVLDTKGVNVWCAAGKGTFGTKELLNRILITKLSGIVSHKILILPQLGAPGISAHEVVKQSGFRVVYGPIRAEDIKEFLKAGMKAKEEMREVKFNIIDRVILTPIELISTFKIAILVFGIMFLVNLIAINPFGVVDFYALMGALIIGTVITPVLLPWIPVRAFAAKGWIMGLMWAITVNMLNVGLTIPEYGILKASAYLLILPSVASYFAMNFTGSSTYTSFSGVIKEMKVAVPVIAFTIGLGIVILMVNCFIHI